MIGPPLIPMALGGSVAGVLGWRLLRARVWHSLYDETPAGMSAQQYQRRLRLIARLKTMARAALCALAGVLTVWTVWH
jgi:hypothetical protein